jgi:hypothetical protein
VTARALDDQERGRCQTVAVGCVDNQQVVSANLTLW